MYADTQCASLLIDNFTCINVANRTTNPRKKQLNNSERNEEDCVLILIVSSLHQIPTDIL